MFPRRMRTPSLLFFAAASLLLTLGTQAQELPPAPADAVPATSESAPATPDANLPPAEATAQPPTVPVAPPKPAGPPPYSIEIDLGDQKAYLLKNGRTFAASPISSGRYGHLTPTGDFSVIEKDRDHKSTLYGKIVDGSGRTVIGDANSRTRVPSGCKFVRAPMKYFIRFEGAQGLHAGNLPGYPASHGCVRMPLAKAKLFFDHVDLGAPVHVFGKTPARKPVPRIAREQVRVQRAQPAPTPPPPRGLFQRLFGARTEPAIAPVPGRRY